MKLTSFFISKTSHIYAKTLSVSQSTFKILAMSPWMLFEIVLMSALISKQAQKLDGAIFSKLQVSRC